MARTNIQWTQESWNPTTGCTRASAGCDLCYAYAMTKRLAGMGQEKYQGLVGNGHFNGVVKTWNSELINPLQWKKPRMIFVNSMSDLFHKEIPAEFIANVFATMYEAQWHTFQVLTKRAERLSLLANPRFPHAVGTLAWNRMPKEKSAIVTVEEVIQDVMDNWPLRNVWVGASVENNACADERIPYLKNCSAWIKFLSCEPLIEEIDLEGTGLLYEECRVCIDQAPDRETNVVECRQCDSTGIGDEAGIDWVIAGGESGPHARPCNVNWIRAIKDQCERAKVPVFIKQLGSHVLLDGPEVSPPFGTRWVLKDSKGGDIEEFPLDLRIRQFPERISL